MWPSRKEDWVTTEPAKNSERIFYELLKLSVGESENIDSLRTIDLMIYTLAGFSPQISVGGLTRKNWGEGGKSEKAPLMV